MTLFQAVYRDLQYFAREVPVTRDAVVITAIDAANGVGDALEDVVAFPTVALQYITGTTNLLGEMGSWARFGSKYKVREGFGDNPLTRAAQVVNHMVYGTIDLFLGHLPYRASVALGTQAYTPFFSPAPTDARGVARDLTAVSMVFAMPAAKAKGYALLGIPEKAVHAKVQVRLTTGVQETASATLRKILAAYDAASNKLMIETRSGFSRGAIEIPKWMLPPMTEADFLRVFRQAAVSESDLQGMTHHAEAKVANAARQVLSERIGPMLGGDGPPSLNLFVVSLEYRVPLEVVAEHLAAHRTFLENNYRQGVFIVSGRKAPRTGGVIIASTLDRATLETILEQDPFKQHGIADYQITEFVPVMHCEAFSRVLTRVPE